MVGERGIAGLSHRAVAAAADVPLNSTTYHFATLDELLVAALRQCNEACFQEIEERPLLGSPGADLAAELAAELAGFVVETVSRDRTRARLEYELHLAALRRDALRPVAVQWVDRMTGLLTRWTDPATAGRWPPSPTGCACRPC